jgi:hypothetical protein
VWVIDIQNIFSHYIARKYVSMGKSYDEACEQALKGLPDTWTVIKVDQQHN